MPTRARKPPLPRKSADASEAAFARLAATLSEDRRVDPPEVARAKGFGTKGLKVARKMFAFGSKGRLIVKLPQSRVDELVSAGKGRRFEPSRGRTMKEWLAVPRTAQAAWLPLAREALNFAAKPRS